MGSWTLWWRDLQASTPLRTAQVKSLNSEKALINRTGGIKLPKLQPQSLNGDISGWQNFWHEFCGATLYATTRTFRQATRGKRSYASGSGTPRSCMRYPQCKQHSKGHGQQTIITSVGPAPEARIFSSTQRFPSKRSSPGLTQKIKPATLAPPPREGESDIYFIVKMHPANSTYKF